MLSFPGRNGRRRRVLNEEVLSASSSHAVLRAMTEDRSGGEDAPRYSDAAGVENHPQVSDFIPRKYRSIATLVLTGVVTTAALAGVHYFAISIGEALGLAQINLLDFASPGSLASWLSAVVLLLCAATCVLVYSIRRHRINDFRGRYRVWMAAAAACVVLSANSVVSLHSAATDTLASATGFWALRDASVWWLVLAGLPLAWIAVRMLVDVKECRLALTLVAGAVLCNLFALGVYLRVLRVVDVRLESLDIGAAMLLGSWLLLAGVVSYGRYVVLDAQGLITPRQKAKASSRKARNDAVGEATAAASGKLAAPAASGRVSGATSSASRAGAPLTEWVDGRRAERERYEEDGDDNDDRKLTKAERKQLRKLKARDRAA